MGCRDPGTDEVDQSIRRSAREARDTRVGWPAMSGRPFRVGRVRQTLTTEIQDAALRSLFSARTMQKGSAYARSGRVIELTVDESGHTLTGQVVGSGGRRYHTTVTLDGVDAVGDGYLDAFCTCPVGSGCKHAAALLVAARDGRRRGAVTASAPDWERLLTPVVRPASA